MNGKAKGMEWNAKGMTKWMDRERVNVCCLVIHEKSKDYMKIHETKRVKWRVF
jgi:hypothetical protein